MSLSEIAASDLLSLDKKIAPTLIKFVYWIGLAFIALSAIGMIFMSFGPMGGATTFIMAILGAVLGALIWRVACEIWIVIFTINDNLARLADKDAPKT